MQRGGKCKLMKCKHQYNCIICKLCGVQIIPLYQNISKHKMALGDQKLAIIDCNIKQTSSLCCSTPFWCQISQLIPRYIISNQIECSFNIHRQTLKALNTSMHWIGMQKCLWQHIILRIMHNGNQVCTVTLLKIDLHDY